MHATASFIQVWEEKRSDVGLATVECFDPEGTYPVWQSVPSMTKRRAGVGVGVVDNLLYAIGGWDGKHSSSVERYNAFSNS
ncbi:kelch repeat protein [Cooperia oncophora]